MKNPVVKPTQWHTVDGCEILQLHHSCRMVESVCNGAHHLSTGAGFLPSIIIPKKGRCHQVKLCQAASVEHQWPQWLRQWFFVTTQRMGGTNKYCIIYFTSALICCLYLFNCLNSGRLEKSTDWFQAKSLPETMDFLVKYIEISFSFPLKPVSLENSKFPDWPTENDHVPVANPSFHQWAGHQPDKKRWHIPAISSSYRES